jgi:hypothetical protein
MIDFATELFTIGISLGVVGVACAVILYYPTKTVTPKKKTFQIVLSEGTYDIRLNGRRLTSKLTLDDAKLWLELNRSNYLKEDLVVYEESYEEDTKIH